MRWTRSTRTFVIAVASLLVVAAGLTRPAGLPPAEAIENPANVADAPGYWAPNYAVTQLSDYVDSYGKLAYFLNWSGPLSLDGWLDCRNPADEFGNCTGDSVLEIGFKDIYHEPMSCTAAGLTGKGGFPPEVEVLMDYTEDPEDAVIWIADLRILRADQQAFPDRIYSAWTDCGADNSDRRDGHFYGESSAELEVQVGHWDGIKSPATTYSDATLHYVPQELSGQFIPEPFSDEFIQTDMLAPWLIDPSFEEEGGGWFPSADVNFNRVCDRVDAPSLGGRCHGYITHTQPSAPGSIGYQDFCPELCPEFYIRVCGIGDRLQHRFPA